MSAEEQQQRDVPLAVPDGPPIVIKTVEFAK
jgi:hypothetical protein